MACHSKSLGGPVCINSVAKVNPGQLVDGGMERDEIVQKLCKAADSRLLQ